MKKSQSTLNFSTSKGCPACGSLKKPKHLHGEALNGAHLIGSEHYNCADCGRTYKRDECTHRGFNFFFDVGKSK